MLNEGFRTLNEKLNSHSIINSRGRMPYNSELWENDTWTLRNNGFFGGIKYKVFSPGIRKKDEE